MKNVLLILAFLAVSAVGVPHAVLASGIDHQIASVELAGIGAALLQVEIWVGGPRLVRWPLIRMADEPRLFTQLNVCAPSIRDSPLAVTSATEEHRCSTPKHHAAMPRGQLIGS